MAEPLWTEDSFRKQEYRKFDTPRNQPVLRSDGTPLKNPDGTRMMGEKCVGYEHFPKMLYRAQLNPISGAHEVGASRDVLSKDRTIVIFNAEEFSRTCQHIVRNESEHERAKAEGWRDTPAEAMAYYEGTEAEKMVAAAVRNYEDRNMSPRAMAEAEAAERATAEQVPEIPEKPRDRMAAAREAKAAKRLQTA